MKHDTVIDGFESMPCRVVGELEDRLDRAAKRLKFFVPFLDDYLRGILPNDLVLLGAPSGLGKTDLALNVAASNAMAKRRVHFFALEAEPRELERRTKYSLLSRRIHQSQHPERGRMNYTDWLLGDLEDVVGEFNREADMQILQMLNSMQTYYRGANFTVGDLGKAIEQVYRRSDLIVVDHLHYIDTDTDDNEAKALGETVKAIRDVSLRIGVPILLVAHMRKRDRNVKQIVATLDDFHGSSNVTKISTQVIAIERANIPSEKWFLSPTFVTIPKDRRSGSPNLIALVNFDRRTRSYSDTYALGRQGKGGEWEQVPPVDIPQWAKHHRAWEIAKP